MSVHGLCLLLLYLLLRHVDASSMHLFTECTNLVGFLSLLVCFTAVNLENFKSVLPFVLLFAEKKWSLSFLFVLCGPDEWICVSCAAWS